MSPGQVSPSNNTFGSAAHMVRPRRQPHWTKQPSGLEVWLTMRRAGPRAGIFLIQGAKAMAAMDGRFSVAIEDVKKVAIPVLRHRISTNFQAQAEGRTSEDIVQQLLTTLGEPEPAKYVRKQR